MGGVELIKKQIKTRIEKEIEMVKRVVERIQQQLRNSTFMNLPTYRKLMVQLQEEQEKLKSLKMLEKEQKTCVHFPGDIFYYPVMAGNNGWRCSKCQKELGERPDLDQKYAYSKIRGLLGDLKSANFIYISNGTEAECMTGHVEVKCEGVFTQKRILLEIMKMVNRE